MTNKEQKDQELWSLIRYYETIGKINSVDRIKEVNRKAYFTVKGRAEFMCVNTSTWKDPQ
jgi:hypothetical protein